MSFNTSHPPVVLAFAGTDPVGGAGLQADLLTLSNLGCYAMTVVTAITAQDTEGVAASQAVDAKMVTRQAMVALSDIAAAAFKVGLVGSAENAVAIAKILKKHSGRPVVVDPVLASGRGDALAGKGVISALRDSLLPVATIITPNSIEARQLAGLKSSAPLADAARVLVDRGVPHVLITGTHEDRPQVVNTLYGVEGVVREDAWDRLPGSYHGSGCTLASAIAATLANGLELADAVRAAQEYTWQTLAHATRPGRGQALPDRFFWVRHDGTVPASVPAAVPAAGATAPAGEELHPRHTDAAPASEESHRENADAAPGGEEFHREHADAPGYAESLHGHTDAAPDGDESHHEHADSAPGQDGPACGSSSEMHEMPPTDPPRERTADADERGAPGHPVREESHDAPGATPPAAITPSHGP